MNFLSIDLEDWYTSAYLRHYVETKDVNSRIDYTTSLILEAFDKNNVKATFFVLGSIAKKHPKLIKEISSKGHEIASHGYSHTPLWDLNSKNFLEEIKKTNNVLGDLTGLKPIGFRAPYASLNQSTSWALDILINEGFLYDSSIFPMKTPLYGVKDAPTNVYNISSKNISVHDSNSQLIEIPFSVYKKGILKIPCTGGIYGRFIPAYFFLMLLKKIEKNRPINFYFHPWEIDPTLPKLKVPIYNQIVSYYNTKNYLKLINKILTTFEFNTFKSILNLH